MNIAVLGAGQLAAMMADAGKPLGMQLHCLAPEQNPCAADKTTFTQAKYDDTAAIEALLASCDVLTYEHEKLPLESLKPLEGGGKLRPPLAALAITQDRLAEKRYLQSQGVPTAPFGNIESADDFDAALTAAGLPAILKTRFGGYDGKGQVRISAAGELAAAWAELGEKPCVLEGFVEFNRELSIIAVRGVAGELVYYPVAENDHRDGILRLSRVKPNDAQQQAAEQIMSRLMTDMNYVGVMTLELFESRGELVANEIAPRVHNSGHWSIEGASRSQFENHLRAVTGEALEAPTLVHDCAAMVNIIGEVPELDALAAQPGVAVHLYGKAARAGRKLGHITITGSADAADGFEQRLAEALRQLGEALPQAGEALSSGA